MHSHTNPNLCVTLHAFPLAARDPARVHRAAVQLDPSIKAGFGDITHLKAKGLIPRSDGTKRKSPKYEDKEEQDRDVGKNKGTQPKKYYKGLDKETKQKRDAHFKKGLTGPAPGDKDDEGNPIKTKKSTHTKKFAKMYGEKLDKNADAGDYIDDFRKSDAPQFKGKSDKKIRKMAIAAYLSKKEK